MTTAQNIKLADSEKIWAVCAGCFVDEGYGCIVVKVNQLDGLSNEEIGLHVRHLEWYARFLKTEVLADYIEDNNIRHAPLEDLMEWYSRLQEFAGDDEKIKRMMEQVREEIGRKKQRRKAYNAKERKPRSGFVYLLYGDGYYKIGLAEEIKKRIRQISPQLPFEVELVHTIKTDDMVWLEQHLHGKFATKRTNGEWFKLDAQDVQWLQGMDEWNNPQGGS